MDQRKVLIEPVITQSQLSAQTQDITILRLLSCPVHLSKVREKTTAAVEISRSCWTISYRAILRIGSASSPNLFHIPSPGTAGLVLQ